jgi:DNA-directed RNA polymerase specialized sigma24 family protein
VAPHFLWALLEQRGSGPDGRTADEVEEAAAAALDGPAAVELALVRQLAPLDRLLILGVYWGELSRRQLGVILKRRPRDVSTQLVRAQSVLRRLLQSACSAEEE